MIVLINDDCWCETAGTDTFHLFNAEHSIISGRTCMNPQFGFGMFQSSSPLPAAGNAGADLKMIFPWFLKLIHGVEGDHSLHMGFGNFTDFGTYLMILHSTNLHFPAGQGGVMGAEHSF